MPRHSAVVFSVAVSLTAIRPVSAQRSVQFFVTTGAPSTIERASLTIWGGDSTIHVRVMLGRKLAIALPREWASVLAVVRSPGYAPDRRTIAPTDSTIEFTLSPLRNEASALPTVETRSWSCPATDDPSARATWLAASSRHARDDATRGLGAVGTLVQVSGEDDPPPATGSAFLARAGRPSSSGTLSFGSPLTSARSLDPLRTRWTLLALHSLDAATFASTAFGERVVFGRDDGPSGWTRLRFCSRGTRDIGLAGTLEVRDGALAAASWTFTGLDGDAEYVGDVVLGEYRDPAGTNHLVPLSGELRRNSRDGRVLARELVTTWKWTVSPDARIPKDMREEAGRP